MSEKYKVIVSQRAAQMLVENASFLSKVSVSAAERLVDEFEKTISSLEEMPRRCSIFNADYIPKNSYRYIIFEKRYCALFMVIEDCVYVDYVIDCREDYSWLFK